MHKILITLDKNLLIRLDEEIKRLGHGSNRAGYLRTACEKYLDLTRGVSNRIRKRQLTKELENEAV